MSTTSLEEIKYPKYILTKPLGLDKLEGGSQERLAKNIARHILHNDTLEKEESLPKILGIQGEWGAGKTNVVKLLEKELDNHYCFFEYDAWGHQEDLQRRSILELLTTELVKKGFLSGQTTIVIKGGGEKTVTWEEKLKYLLARKTETVTEKYPRISNGMAALFLVGVLTPVFTYIASATKPSQATWWEVVWSIIIAILPIIISLVVWGIVHCKNKKYDLSYLLAIYNNKIENDVCYETLSEDEPTVSEFKNWMKDISDYILANNKPKLILVFDNMDRLPAEKVRELWSSIHTFFADDGFDNVWAIIPFDKKHLACAFNGESYSETETLTNYFISKTFPVVFRVAPPVITDYISLFDKLYVEAFGNTEEKNRNIINRIYRIARPEANVREIIMFLNALVALKQERNDIDLLNISIFKLYESSLLNQPITQILSGEYMKSLQDIIVNDIQRQSEIASLVYGVELELARQIPITQYIKKCIFNEQGYDINTYSNSNMSFDTVLAEQVYSIDEAMLDSTIVCLEKLQRKNKSIQSIWHSIASRKIKQILNEQSFSKEYKVLLLNITDKNLLKHVIDTLCNKIYTFTDFNSKNYYQAMKEIDVFIKEHNMPYVLTLDKKIVDVEDFLDYVTIAQADYLRYKVQTSAEDLDVYLTKKMNDNTYNYSNVVSLLSNNQNYTFNNLRVAIELLLEQNKVTIKNVGEVMETYRMLSKENGFSRHLDINIANQIWHQLANDNSHVNGYNDIAARLLSSGHNISIKPDSIDKVAQIMDYYGDYGKLLINNLSWRIDSLNNVLRYMTLNGLGKKLDLTVILPKYDTLKTYLSISDEDLIKQLNQWEKDLGDSINASNIKTIVLDAKLYAHTANSEIALAQQLNKIAREALSNVSADDLYKHAASYSSYYWHITATHLLKTDFLQVLPNNLVEFGKKLLFDIASGKVTLPLLEYYSNIINRIDKNSLYDIMSDIRNAYCNDQMKMDANKFKYFEAKLREQGNLETRALDVINKILKPVLKDTDCIHIIFSHQEYYSKLINSVKDAADDFCRTIIDITKDTTDEKVLTFVKSIS